MLQSGAFCGPERLETLDLSRNNLAMAPDLLPVKSSLEYLKLEKNIIQHFPADYFDGFEVLHSVNIGHNQLHSAPNMGYVGHCLRVFAVAGNKLETLDGGLTGGLNMTIMEYLNVRNNKIRHFNVSILAQMPRITYLDLATNQLENMADPTAYLLSTSREWPLALNLYLNPLVCDRGLSWLLVLAENDNSTDDCVCNQPGCHRPHCVKGMDIMILSEYAKIAISRGDLQPFSSQIYVNKHKHIFSFSMHV